MERKWQESTVENNEIVKEGGGEGRIFKRSMEKFLFLSFPSTVIDASLEKKSLLLPFCRSLCKSQQKQKFAVKFT